jgi:hypothetical protein
VSLEARRATILGRFPRHLAADEPGKLLGDVVSALARELEVKTSQLGRVRRSHALGDADERRDLLLLAALHDLGHEAFTVLDLRFAALGDLGARLAAAASDDEAATQLARLPDLLAVPTDAFPPFPEEGAVTGPARARLVTALRSLIAATSRLEQLRTSLRETIALHRAGNGTVAALLGAAAVYLDLQVEELTHADDRYWHVARCRDRLRLVRPEPTGHTPPSTELAPADDLLALEENPLRSRTIDPIERRHGDWFRILRGGLEEVQVTVRVVGCGDRTVAPMVVNLDAGFGFVYTGAVPDGDELLFGGDGGVTLGGASVARLAYAFRGGVFADAGRTHDRAFTFAGESAAPDAQAATFAVTQPIDDAFEPTAAFPHAEGRLEAATMAVGESRWAFFVAAGHFGRDADTPPGELAIPVFEAAAFDTTVYTPDTSPGSPPAARVGFAWQEREPFAVTLWVPRRFAALDAPDQVAVTELLRLRLDRHRAAGVHVYVKYADDRWSLATGVLRDAGSTDARGTVVVGTRLWHEGTEQPPS